MTKIDEIHPVSEKETEAAFSRQLAELGEDDSLQFDLKGYSSDHLVILFLSYYDLGKRITRVEQWRLGSKKGSAIKEMKFPSSV